MCCDQSEQSSIQFTTPDAQESILLTDLDPKRSYNFKIQAVSRAGKSLFSEPNDAIETSLPPPGKPYTRNVTHNSVELTWSKPHCGAEDVTSYIVSILCKQSGSCEEQKTPTVEQCLLLKNLVSKTSYQFRVRAETVTRSSQESELSDIIETLLPSPGKPHTTKKTHNRIWLSWEKPERGSECIQSYTVSYRIEHNLPDKWNETNCVQPQLQFEAISGKMHFFKVKAECGTSCSPYSDISTVMTPTDRPGKPQVSGTFLDGIQLVWAKPAHGATSVQRYTVLYRPKADSGKWCQNLTKGTEEHINVSDLLPGTVYNFKVRAENGGGSSPETEVIEAVLPPDQPGKPWASKIFHDKIILKWSPPKHGAQIVSYYRISYHPASTRSSKNWDVLIVQNIYSATIVGLTPKTLYVFKVKAEAIDGAGSSPDSEFSDRIETLLPPPGKPYATSVSYESFKIKWKKPNSKTIHSYSVYYRCVEDKMDKWSNTVLTDNQFEFSAVPGKLYVFKVDAVTNEGRTSESELSDPIETKVKPWGAKLLPICKKIRPTKHRLSSTIYQLPLQSTMKRKNIVKVVVGTSHFKLPTGFVHKVLMVVGATGAGKSTLINGIANYIMGVDWEDDFRFKLISEETAHDQTKSQTKCITAYTFHKDRGSPLPYTLTVIDTPGFGDTGGLERDKQIVSQIKEFFSIRGDEGIDQLHGIGFVTQAPLARLTPTQRYVFDSILSVFGKDVADNIFLMVTFADGKRPPVLDAARAAGVPFKSNFKFNNSALFACKQADDEFDKIFWKMGKKSFEDFFNHFSKAETQSLQLSREVLQEREQLEVTIQGLQPQIRAGLAKIDELRQERQLLNDHEADIITHENFNYQVQVTKHRKVDLPVGRYTTNCLKCNFTCHDNCIYANDGDKFKCCAMKNQNEQEAICKVCPGQCSWRDHVCNPYKFEIYQDQETRTSDELKAKYESALTDKGEVEAVMKKMQDELKEMDMEVFKKIEQARQSLQRLQEIALRPCHLTEVEYIDMLIESEKQEARPGFTQRVKALEGVQEQAKILAEIKSYKAQEGTSAADHVPFFSLHDDEQKPGAGGSGMYELFMSLKPW